MTAADPVPYLQLKRAGLSGVCPEISQSLCDNVRKWGFQLAQPSAQLCHHAGAIGAANRSCCVK